MTTRLPHYNRPGSIVIGSLVLLVMGYVATHITQDD